MSGIPKRTLAEYAIQRVMAEAIADPAAFLPRHDEAEPMEIWAARAVQEALRRSGKRITHADADLETMDRITEVHTWCAIGLAVRIRKAAGLSVFHVGDLVGVAGMTVNQWERAQTKPRVHHALRYHEVLTALLNGLSPDDATLPLQGAHPSPEDQVKRSGAH